MHIGAAQLILGHLRAQRALDQRRPAREERAARRHHREMPQHRPCRHASRRRAGHGEDERHLLPRANVRPEHIKRTGQMPVPVAFGRDIRPRAFVKDDQRNAVLARHIGEKEALEALLRGNVRRAARDREVLAPHHHLAPVDRRQPADVGQRLEIDEPAILVGAVARQPADFVETARVRNRLDPLANGQLAQLMLSVDALLAAHLEREPTPLVELVHLRLPVLRPILRIGHAAPRLSGQLTASYQTTPRRWTSAARQCGDIAPIQPTISASSPGQSSARCHQSRCSLTCRSSATVAPTAQTSSQASGA